MKNISIQNVQNLVDEIIEIMNDKAIMKNIEIKTKYIGFNQP